MLFNSLVFVAFFALVFALNLVLGQRARNRMLLCASYLFYGAWDWRFLGLVWFQTAVDYSAARVIGRSSSPRVRKLVLLVSVGSNLTLLGFFKYYNFFIDSLDLLLAPLGATAAGLHLDLVLPVGISFYTFQSMSYTIDVYRGRMQPVRNLADFALFVCFFPQLVAGPIERAPHLVPQIQRPRRVTARHLHEGLLLASWGLFKKVVVADNLARIVDPIYAAGAQPSGLDVLLGTWAFLFQLYADFSGYSDIARGTARLLGFDLMRNFATPYLARDIGEFWRRWHISLSSWLRDYLYVPLGGNRRSEARVALNLWLTLFLAGLWHGAAGTFLAWGAYHGVLVVLTRWYRKLRPLPRGPRWPGVLLSVNLVAIGMVFFRGQSLAQCLAFFEALLTDFTPSAAALPTLAWLGVCALPLVVGDLCEQRSGSEFFVLRWSAPARVLTYLVLFYGIVLFGRSDGLDFVYFQF